MHAEIIDLFREHIGGIATLLGVLLVVVIQQSNKKAANAHKLSSERLYEIESLSDSEVIRKVNKARAKEYLIFALVVFSVSLSAYFYTKTSHPDLFENATFQGFVFVVSPLSIIFLLGQALGNYFADD